MAAQGADPLSFFAGDASSSSESESEDEDKSGVIPLNDKSYYTSSKEQSSQEKLPSPDSLFATVGTPEFLTTHLQPHKVDWDKLAKNPDSEDNFNLAGGVYSAVPPPPSDTDSHAEIAAAPIKYSAPPPDTVDAKLLTVSSNMAAGEKRQASNESHVPSGKKQKGELFREKEKRKRDLGMSSRGKNFVEEEKRILRQQFGQ